jgi:hypothetical protein
MLSEHHIRFNPNFTGLVDQKYSRGEPNRYPHPGVHPHALFSGKPVQQGVREINDSVHTIDHWRNLASIDRVA